MKEKKLLLLTMLTASLLFMASPAALATPGANLLYYETDLGGGQWQYDYTFYNTSDAGESLYSVYFDFGQDTSFDWINIPSGWDSVLNGFTPIDTAFTDTYSTATGNDITAGNSLGLFSFTVDYQAGDIYYDAYLSEDNVVSGITSIVPEPISSLLFVTGGTLLAGRRYLRKRGVMKLWKICKRWEIDNHT